MGLRWLAGYMMGKYINKRPIEVWADLLDSDLTEVEIKLEWAKLFEDVLPYTAGLILNGYCNLRCRHCFYPPDYGRYNKSMSESQWENAVKAIYQELGIRDFVHNGRSFDRHSIEILTYIKSELEGSSVGIIDNGFGISNFLKPLKAIQPDWVDISIDGMHKDHDYQRNCKGAFQKAVETLDKLMQMGITDRINILTCLTTLNQNSIVEMIKFLSHSKGIANFFISPVSTREGFYPSPSLKVSDVTLNRLIYDVYDALRYVKNVSVEFNFFNADYFNAFYEGTTKSLFPHDAISEYADGNYGNDCLLYLLEKNENRLVVSWYPLSLDGVREFVVNCNGDILMPRAMANSHIDKHEKMSSLLEASPMELRKRIVHAKCFDRYLEEFKEEKKILYHRRQK